ncbi:POK8 protein, partial [Ciccaba nigrolineata]|nr:POK8 protein [Ciccaba nigrolineata]
TVIVIDLKDCFFMIPLHPEDQERFAFSVPSVNLQKPQQRYQWTVLPQGMKNSPTMCQMYVDWALKPIQMKQVDWLIYHYMDDIFIAAQNLDAAQAIPQLTK